MVAISPDVDGRVVAVEVAENQLVRQGDVLFRLDPEPFQIALDMAEAKMLAVRNDVEGKRAEFRQIEAEIGEAEERVAFYAHQAERQRELQGRGISTEVRLEEAEVELMAARQRVAALQEKLRTVLAKLGGDPASARRAAPPLSAGRGRARHGGVGPERCRGPRAGRRRGQPDAPAARGVGRGGRADVQRHQPGDHLDRGQSQGDPARARRRSASWSRSRSTPTPTPCGSARSPASARRPAPSSR